LVRDASRPRQQTPSRGTPSRGAPSRGSSREGRRTQRHGGRAGATGPGSTTTIPKDASAIFHDQVGYGELERLSALETLKGLRNPETVTLGELVRFLDSRGLWPQFAKITLGDLRDGFTPQAEPSEAPPAKKRKRRILEDELEDALAEKAARERERTVEDGGMSTDEFARLVMPFIEGNDEVTLDDIEEYSRLDRKVLRHHLGVLVKEGRLERLGVGRHALYSAL
jgi:hypothetical protein